MRRLISLFLAAVCVVTSASLSAGGVSVPSEFGYTVKNGSYVITGYYGSEERIVIPEGVKEIGVSAFEDNLDITEVVLPSSVEVIDRRAFDGCENLTKISFPDGLKIIEESAFRNTGLEKVLLPDSVEFIGDHAFHGCECTEVWLPDGLESLEWNVFSNCYMLETVEFPSALKTVGEGAFTQCFNAELILPEGVKSVYSCAFDRVKSVHIPSTVETLSEFFLGAHQSAYKPKITAPRYSTALSTAIRRYEDIEIEYTEETEAERFQLLTKKYKRKVILDIDFCGDPELLALDENGCGQIFFQHDDELIRAQIKGIENDRIYFGETDRKLYHLKDKDGRQFFLFTVLCNDKSFPARLYILEPTYINKEDYINSYYGKPAEEFSCTEIGTQKLHIYNKYGDALYFASEQTAGEHYSLEYDVCKADELFTVLREKMQRAIGEYISGFELCAEYELDRFFTPEPTEKDITLGSFSESAEKYEPPMEKVVVAMDKTYNAEENRVTLRLGRSCEAVDFDSLSKLANLSVLEISAESVISLKGIEKLKNLRSLTLKTGFNGGFTDMAFISETKVQSLSLCGEFDRLDFIADCGELSCLKLSPDSIRSDAFYSPVGKAGSLRLIVLGTSERNGTVNFTLQNQTFLYESSEAVVHCFGWENSVPKALAKNFTFDGYSAELPWLKI